MGGRGGEGGGGDAGTASGSWHAPAVQYNTLCSRAVHRLPLSPHMVQARMNGKNKGIHRGLTAA